MLAVLVPLTGSHLWLSLGTDVFIMMNSCFLLSFYCDVSLRFHALLITPGWEAAYLGHDYSCVLKCFGERTFTYFLMFIIFSLFIFSIFYHKKFLVDVKFILNQFLSLSQNTEAGENMLHKLFLKLIQFLGQTEYDFFWFCF